MFQLIDQLIPLLSAMGLLLPRFLLVIFFIPAFSATVLPARVRYLLALALSLPLLPGLFAQLTQHPVPLLEWVLLLMKETSLGLLLGCVLAIPFWVFEAAGVYLDNQRGGNPQAVNPLISSDASVMGLMLQQGLTIALMKNGLFLTLLGPVYSSFAIWSPLTFWPAFSAGQSAAYIALFTHLMTASLVVASPFLIVLLIVELGFGIAARWSPQLPAYTAAQPVKALLAVLLLAYALPTLWQVGQDDAMLHTQRIQAWLGTFTSAPSFSAPPFQPPPLQPPHFQASHE